MQSSYLADCSFEAEAIARGRPRWRLLARSALSGLAGRSAGGGRKRNCCESLLGEVVTAIRVRARSTLAVEPAAAPAPAPAGIYEGRSPMAAGAEHELTSWAISKMVGIKRRPRKAVMRTHVALVAVALF